MGKVLIATFDDGEIDINELILFLKKNGQAVLANDFINNGLLDYGNILIDPKYRVVNICGKDVELTNYEFEILYLLARNPGQVFSKEQIYNQVWNSPCFGAENNVMSLIRRIRKKIEPDSSKPVYILTVWGIGYKFNSELK